MTSNPASNQRDSSRTQSATNETTVNGADEPTGSEMVDIDHVFDILRNQRRRYVLRYLATGTEPATLGTLAERIAAWECDKNVDQISSQERKRVYVGLYQGHLPKMDAVGAIAYNKDRGIIDRGQHFDRFESYLPSDGDVGGENERSLTQYIRDIIDT